MKSSIKPILFSKQFGVDAARLATLGVFDPTLNVDTLLFPDPMLLERSKHPEMISARSTFDNYFERVRKFLLLSEADENSVAWKSAKKLLSFPEVMGTCLGYGAGSISGSGAGPKMTERLLKTGYQIAKMGIDDPDLFMAMGLFEEDFGPDLIGDMFTNIAFGELVSFNERILKELSLDGSQFSITLKNGMHHTGVLLRNPINKHSDVPIILTPLDVLRDLPVAIDWRGVQSMSEENREFRRGLNASVSAMWSRKSLESKAQLRDWALSSPSTFGDLLDLLHGMDGKPYDFAGDKLGEIVWRSFGEDLLRKHPFPLQKPQKLDHQSVLNIVDKIISQFQFLIEERDLWRELYTEEGLPRIEKAAQRLFYMSAISYCEANNLDITPEAETGRGPVDFKFSNGIHGRVLVEIKLSKNSQIVNGFTKQLSAYNVAEKSFDSRYVIIDVGEMGKKLKAVRAARANQIKNNMRAPEIVVINGLRKLSASKLK